LVFVAETVGVASAVEGGVDHRRERGVAQREEQPDGGEFQEGEDFACGFHVDRLQGLRGAADGLRDGKAWGGGKWAGAVALSRDTHVRKSGHGAPELCDFMGRTGECKSGEADSLAALGMTTRKAKARSRFPSGMTERTTKAKAKARAKRSCSRWTFGLSVFAEHAEDFALDADAGGGGVDGGHFGVGGLEADEVAFAVEALEGGVRAVDQGNDYFAFAGGAGALDQDVIARDYVFVAHGVAADFEGVDLAVADDVAERDGLGGFDGLYGFAGGDAAEQG